MSGLAAIYNLDGSPVAPKLLAEVRDAASARGPDAATQWISGPVGLAHRMLRTTPESLDETQPLSDASGEIHLIYDGRVDNRGELAADFAAHGITPRHTPRAPTDAELLLCAYQRWGQDFPVHVLGDFVAVLWDARRQVLFCARDVMFMKPLLYFSDGKTFLCASDIRQFFAHPAFHPEPNEGMIAGHLAGRLGNNHETLYRGLLRLPPAHAIEVSPKGVALRRYWDFDPKCEVRYKSNQEYDEHFRALFRESVRCRMRSHCPVALDFSGGLDSAAIAAVGKTIEHEGPSTAPSLDLYTLALPLPAFDELDVVEETAARWNAESFVVVPQAREDVAASAARFRDLPTQPSGRGFDAVRILQHSRGVRVVLQGEGGNEWFGGHPMHQADLLKRLRIPALAAQYRAEKRMDRMDFARFLRNGVGPLVPASWRKARRNWRGPEAAPDWITPAFAERTALMERSWFAPSPEFPTHAQWGIYQEALGDFNIRLFEIEERTTAEFAMEARMPYLDRRLTEFALALPEEQRRQDGVDRVIVRRALGAELPRELRTPDASAVFASFFEEIGGEAFFRSLELVKLGWVESKSVLAMYQRAKMIQNWTTPPRPNPIWPLWLIVGLEVWYRSTFQCQ